MSLLRHVLLTGFWASLSLSVGCGDDREPVRSFEEPLPARLDADEWVFVFGDEFDGNAVDLAKWMPLDGDPGHKNTINSTSSSRVAVRDGSIFVTAVPKPEDKAFPYATGYVDTSGLFAQTYGKIEFRARCQYAPGVWYALWGRSWRRLVPELDIEFLAENINQAWFVNHWGVPPAAADDRRGFTTVDGLDITDFHTYTITWKPDLVEWQIDGKAFRRVTDPARIPHEPMFWVMNAWVGGWGGTPKPATAFPAGVEVDYLRIYRLREWSTAPAIAIADPKSKYPLTGAISVELADYEPGARVEVRDGATLVATMTKPPFRFPTANLSRSAHELTFTGTDGARMASTSISITVY